MLRKWKASDPLVLKRIPRELLDHQLQQDITYADAFTKVLDVEWNAGLDSFHPTISLFSSDGAVTKRALASDIARIFDVMGWCSPCIIRPKISLQRLWECELTLDDPVPTEIYDLWGKWHSELPMLKTLTIPQR